jgi:hypothetical protein
MVVESMLMFAIGPAAALVLAITALRVPPEITLFRTATLTRPLLAATTGAIVHHCHVVTPEAQVRVACAGAASATEMIGAAIAIRDKQTLFINTSQT